ncbi:probable protein phosphatase 2C 26 [Prosopis cineraria]|uniref:probable protein phosphatase 2C 26 n=1 Tax=Prosopis cineraria TaxID=364024 RepID=UPI0024103FCE|nr:probable protein phosphatase 2C 26 [Prosopis cineraria]
MAFPMFRASVSQSQIQPLFHYLSATPSRVDETNRRRKMVLSCSHSEINSTRSEVSFSVGTCLIPHPKKVDRGGEDAFFVSDYNGGVIAVADGVSGWAEEDVDPSLFPREFLAYASSFVGDEEVNYDPQNLIGKAHAATSSIGSATVIVAMLEKNGTLKIANVGDCGLRIIRSGHVIFATSPQEHYFDCPFQLSSQMAGQTCLDAVVSKVELIEGDTIIMGSDGLFDNVFDHEMVSIIASCTDVSEAAKALANLASNHAKDSNFDSPYSIEARSRGIEVPFWKKILGMKLIGGKVDDITVIVGQVVSS